MRCEKRICDVQLRDPAEVCYSWGSVACGDLSVDCLCNDEMLWQGVVSLARGLGSPAEVVWLML